MPLPWSFLIAFIRSIYVSFNEEFDCPYYTYYYYDFLSLAAYYVLLTAYYSVHTAYYLILTYYYLLLTAYYFLLTTYYL